MLLLFDKSYTETSVSVTVENLLFGIEYTFNRVELEQLFTNRQGHSVRVQHRAAHSSLITLLHLVSWLGGRGSGNWHIVSSVSSKSIHGHLIKQNTQRKVVV